MNEGIASAAPVLVEPHATQAGVWVVTLNQPRKRNAFSLAMRERLFEVLYALMYREAECHAIVLAGAGGTFCAGGDITEMRERSLLEYREIGDLPLRIFELMASGPKPVIAAVEGAAMGAGLSLAAVCDSVVATPDARFCAAFARVGMLPDTGLYWSLARRIGEARSREMMLSAREVSGTEGLKTGLVDELAAPGETIDVACRVAQGFVSKGSAVAMALLRSSGANGSDRTAGDAIQTEAHFLPLLRSQRDASAPASGRTGAGGLEQDHAASGHAGDPFKLDFHDGVAVIGTVAGPVRRVTRSQWIMGLERAMHQVHSADAGVRSIVLSGDILAWKDPERATGGGATVLQQQAEAARLGDLLLDVATCGFAVVAEAGGDLEDLGLALALSADVIVAEAQARLLLDDLSYALLPRGLLLWSLPRRIGPARARQLLAAEKTLEAQQAHRIGLVDRVLAGGSLRAASLACAKEMRLPERRLVAIARHCMAFASDTLDQSLQASALCMAGVPVASTPPAAGAAPAVTLQAPGLERQGHAGQLDLRRIGGSDASSKLQVLHDFLQANLADPQGIRALVLSGFDALAGTDGNIACRDRLLRLMTGGPMPLVAAVSGSCSGTALALALACDFVVARSDTSFGAPLTSWPCMSTPMPWLLARRMGPGKARAFSVLGACIDAGEAEQSGLVSMVVDPGALDGTAFRIATSITHLPPVTIGLLKSALLNGAHSLAVARRHELDLPPTARATTDHREAIKAFLEKRAPVFTGN